MHGDDVRDVGEPFAAPDADVILRSFDNVDFRSYRVVPKLASPVFETMFALPSPPKGSTESDEQKDGLPVVCMVEDKQSLQLLLSFCHPNAELGLDTLDDLALAVRLTAKFELSNAKRILRPLLREHLHSDPERVYALAWVMQSRDLVLSAALESLSSPLILPDHADTNIPEFRDISAHALRQLINFQSRCIHSASRIGDDFQWLKAEDIPRRARGKSVDSGGLCGTCPNTKVQLKEPSDRLTRVKDWWLLHVKSLGRLFEEGIDLTEISRIPHGPLKAAVSKGNACDGQDPCRADEIVEVLIATASLVEARVKDIIREAAKKLDMPFT
ncbi:unnamed protein product [Peniophora sp. CBMAI 1063]|nr:unnamed protein product [Peniophora sp. CBMAI 1063]